MLESHTAGATDWRVTVHTPLEQNELVTGWLAPPTTHAAMMPSRENVAKKDCMLVLTHAWHDADNWLGMLA